MHQPSVNHTHALTSSAPRTAAWCPGCPCRGRAASCGARACAGTSRGWPTRGAGCGGRPVSVRVVGLKNVRVWVPWFGWGSVRVAVVGVHEFVVCAFFTSGIHARSTPRQKARIQSVNRGEIDVPGPAPVPRTRSSCLCLCWRICWGRVCDVSEEEGVDEWTNRLNQA